MKRSALERERSLRAKRDLSRIYAIPPLSCEAAPQPDAMTVLLFDYQRRAVARMLAVERGVEVEIDRAKGIRTRPRGGVLCEAVGMGKTAEIMGLCLHNPPSEQWRQSDANGALGNTRVRGGTMVISPEHLALQWVTEIRRFCPGMKVSLLNLESENITHRTLNKKSILEADFFVVTLSSFMTLLRLYTNFLPTFFRIVIDECHDVVSLGSTVTKALAQTPCDHVWCVTGTPFPHQDASVWGINQLLHIKVKFVISDNPFTNAKTCLPPGHPFEVLKRNIYVCNDPAVASRESRASSTSSDTEPPPSFVISTIPVHFSNVEWAFYQDESRRITSTNLFSDQYATLRKLCCHPASGRWMARLNEDRNETEKEFSVLSLDQLRARMVTWKKEDVQEVHREIEVMQNRISIGRNTIALIARVHPEYSFSKSNNSTVQGLLGEGLGSEKLRSITGGGSGGGGVLENDSSINLYDALDDSIVYQPHISVRVQASPASKGAYTFEKKYKAMIDLSDSKILSLLNSSLSFLKTCREIEATKLQEIKEIKRQAEYFDNMITLTVGAVSGSGGAIKKGSMTNTSFSSTSSSSSSSFFSSSSSSSTSLGLSHQLPVQGVEMDEAATSRTTNCFICAEDVFLLGVTPCQHCACLDCLTKWVNKNKHCPTCRNEVLQSQLLSVDLRVEDKAETQEKEENDVSEEETPVTRQATEEALRYGSKPAAVLAYCREKLYAPGGNRNTKMLLFSSYNESLTVLSKTLTEQGLLNYKGDDHVTEVIEQFKKTSNKNKRILLMNSRHLAAGTNLQCASHVVFLEPAGDNKTQALSIETQAIGRTCRIGQEQTVQVAYFVMAETVESKIYQLLAQARQDRDRGGSRGNNTASVGAPLVTNTNGSSSSSISSNSSGGTGSFGGGGGGDVLDDAAIIINNNINTNDNSSIGINNNSCDNDVECAHQLTAVLQYESQLLQLREMGFCNVAENIKAIRATASGSVHSVVEILLRANMNGGSADRESEYESSSTLATTSSERKRARTEIRSPDRDSD